MSRSDSNQTLKILSYFKALQAKVKVKVKVKSACEPSGSSGGSLSIAGLPPALNSPVPIYTPEWREAL